MNEIGGFLEMGGLIINPYHKDAIELNTATNALIYLIESKNIEKIYLPYYLCNCFDKIRNICKVEYYKVNKDFTPNFQIILNKNEYLYFVNYYGLFNNRDIVKLRNKYKNIIVDNVQSFFQLPVKDIDTIYSCRKYFGVPDGAYLYSNIRLKKEIPQDKSFERFKHILGRLEENACNHFEEYKKNEEALTDLSLSYMSKSTKLIMGAENYKKIKKIRVNNFKYLNNALYKINEIKIHNVGTYMYPFYTKDAENIRNELIKNNIYIPILWPNVLKQNIDKIGYDYAINIIPLPCDQRYTTDDMNKIIKIIKGDKL